MHLNAIEEDSVFCWYGTKTIAHSVYLICQKIGFVIICGFLTFWLSTKKGEQCIKYFNVTVYEYSFMLLLRQVFMALFKKADGMLMLPLGI